MQYLLIYLIIDHSTFDYEGVVWAGVHDRRIKSDGEKRTFTSEDVLIYPCNYYFNYIKYM